ncbi:50S ribosomal protein L4 [Salinicoccus halodurans]|uniref:Large ribosomal subunit protein uL4 n=1 Tax=Salinicoccus halodurans TaxID=407035 RepID=A0A0F7HIY8_9STAP|nr:50S ribosomal protein L4 [Salinicoccus halodurans]AKG72979.1 50S ribosomal protein L4 [Salinicoccus halodurans]SFK76955.1 LSU ribosomal protein L4P [Salinicoccus halodurans]
MASLDVLSKEGTKVNSIDLNQEIFGIEPNQHVLFEAVNLQRASLRRGTHSVKNRSAVRGGGKKPFRQKGTGNARQGTIRAPHYRGGGVVFGPTPRSYSYKMPRKMRRLALRSALSAKVNEEAFTVVENFTMDAPKTKDFLTILENLEASKKVLLVLENEDVNIELSSRNLQGVTILTPQQLNVLDILSANRVIFTEGAINKAEEVLL